MSTQDMCWHGTKTCFFFKYIVTNVLQTGFTYWPLHLSVWWCDNTWHPAVLISAQTTTTLSHEPVGSGHSECDSKLKGSCTKLRKVIISQDEAVCGIHISDGECPQTVLLSSVYIYIPARRRLVYVCFSCWEVDAFFAQNTTVFLTNISSKSLKNKYHTKSLAFTHVIRAKKMYNVSTT